MPRFRHPWTPLRYAPVAGGRVCCSRRRAAWPLAALAIWCVGALLGPTQVGCEEDTLASDLALAGRESEPLDERLNALNRVLKAQELPPGDAAARAALSLWEAAERPAAWLALRALDSGLSDLALGERLRERAAASRSAPAVALAYMLGERPESAVLRLVEERNDPCVGAVLEREIGGLRLPDGRPLLQGDSDALRARLLASRPAALALDQALSSHAAEAFAGMDAVCALGPEADELLRHELESGVRGEPPGRMPRAARAAVLLGVRKDVGAREVLARALSSPDGWVRTAAATALGDLGEAAGSVALAWHLATLGDAFRQRDQWEYPGVSETDVPPDAWGNVEYFAVDSAAADALLALGIPNALGYLLHERLDPLKAWFRIRVLQDSVDALDRHAPWLREAAGDAPYIVDQGSSLRRVSFRRMALAWHARRDDPSVISMRLDEEDPLFAREAARLAALLAGESVRERMIARATCALLGRAMTPSLIAALAQGRSPADLLDLVRTLGDVRDRRAVPALLALLQHDSPPVRGAAADALGSYATQQPQVVDALLAALSDRSEETRSGALRGLVGAPRDARILEALSAGTAQAPRTGDDEIVASVVFFVQEGAARWEPIHQGLSSPRVYVRRTWWDLLRRALDLPPWVHDPVADPAGSEHRRLDQAAALAAWQERHGP